MADATGKGNGQGSEKSGTRDKEENYRPLLIVDSGAYSASTRKGSKPINLQEYIAYLHRWKAVDPTMQYVNLDVIPTNGEDTGKLSYMNWREMRAQGLDPVPVFHANSDIKWLKKYLDNTNYVAVGAIADVNTDKRMRALDKVFEDFFLDRNRMPKVRVHAMGVTSFPIMRRYPWFSVDSSSWIGIAMYGKIFGCHVKDGKWDYEKKPYQMNLSTKSDRKKKKGLHLTTLAPAAQKTIERYVNDCGFKLGKSHFEGVEEIVDERGVSNNYYDRSYINALFYARFLHTMRWPRAFGHRRPQGFFDVGSDGGDSMSPNEGEEPTCTRLYLSGEIAVENFMRRKSRDFGNCGVMLTYFNLRDSEVHRPARRITGLCANLPYVDGKARRNKPGISQKHPDPDSV